VTDPTAELTPAFWHNVTAAFQASDAAFDGYYARKSRGWNVQACTGSCKSTEICGLQAARAQDNCVTPTPGVHFSKRMENLFAERDECGISVARAAMGSLVVRRDVLDLVEKRVVETRAAARL
jgi:sphingomyelin phosphodiesterase